MKKIYIAGPMTGYENYNYETFNRIGGEWEERGWAVHNPATAYNGSTRLPYRLYMNSAVQLLLQSEAIALIDGWENSRGATMEALIAQRMGLPFYNAHTGRRMKIDTLVVADPVVIETGSAGFSPNGALIEQLVPIARRLAAYHPVSGITISDIRRVAEEEGILTGEEHRHQLSALSAVPAAAGLTPTDSTRKATTPSARGRRQVVWISAAA